MEKEFVSYEQAVVLNKLHYDGDYNYTYDIKKELWYGDIKADGKKYLAAPLKQQVFRWFREKYLVIGWVEGKLVYRWCIESPIPTDGQLNFSPFKTYEEAENACIDKLIQLAKQQDGRE